MRRFNASHGALSVAGCPAVWPFALVGAPASYVLYSYLGEAMSATLLAFRARVGALLTCLIDDCLNLVLGAFLPLQVARYIVVLLSLVRLANPGLDATSLSC